MKNDEKAKHARKNKLKETKLTKNAEKNLNAIFCFFCFCFIGNNFNHCTHVYDIRIKRLVMVVMNH